MRNYADSRNIRMYNGLNVIRDICVCVVTCTRELYRGIIDVYVNWNLQISYECMIERYE